MAKTPPTTSCCTAVLAGEVSQISQMQLPMQFYHFASLLDLQSFNTSCRKLAGQALGLNALITVHRIVRVSQSKIKKNKNLLFVKSVDVLKVATTLIAQKIFLVSSYIQTENNM